MSTPEEEFLGPRSNHPKYVLRYTVNGEDDRFAEGVAQQGHGRSGLKVLPDLTSTTTARATSSRLPRRAKRSPSSMTGRPGCYSWNATP